LVEALPILGQAAAAIEPSDGALDDPSLGQDGKALCCIGTLDDFHVDLPEDFANGGLKDRPLIAAVGLELQQEWMQAKQCGHHQHPAATILDVRRMYKGVEQQALGIDQDVALLALDLLFRIVAMRVNPRPPFSALLTL
jgi:hypothetical protein